MERVLTTCPYCGCGCGMYLMAENDKLTGVTPSRNHPISRGRLCVKGWNVYEFVNSPDRLTTPLVKTDKGFKEATWDEALDLVAKKLSDIKANDPDQIGVFTSAKCTNEDNYALMKFTRAVLGTNNIDHCARL